MSRAKTVRLSRLYLPLVCLYLLAVVAGRWFDPSFVQALRLVAFDAYQRLSPEAYNPDIPVRIVDIDQDSLARFGQWPWPRTRMRDLVEKLGEGGAAAIAFDVFSTRLASASPRSRKSCSTGLSIIRSEALRAQ